MQFFGYIPEAETDAFIYQVRKAFPLVAKRISDSVEGEANDTAIENVEARNVCDGLLLLEHVRTNKTKTYPWGKDLDRGTAAQEAIVNEEVTALFDIHDAIADVAIAESVHQLTVGNADRAAALSKLVPAVTQDRIERYPSKAGQAPDTAAQSQRNTGKGVVQPDDDHATRSRQSDDARERRRRQLSSGA